VEQCCTYEPDDRPSAEDGAEWLEGLVSDLEANIDNDA
jgi:hypothetical protein